LQKYPPQAVENRKIIGVSVWARMALFSAGKGLAEKGNTLGCVTQGKVMRRTARRLHKEHLSKKKVGGA
jgi:hypothetical protein